MPIEKSAGAVIFKNEDKIYYLLLHYQAGHWDFPKGHIEKGETPQEAAFREAFEETGIKEMELFSGFKKTIKYFFKRDKKSILKIVVFFLVGTGQKEVKISWEHIGFKWLEYDKALEQITYKNAKEILKKANKFILKKI